MFQRRIELNNSNFVNHSSRLDDFGLTLLEVLISLVITGIIAVMVLNFYLSQYFLSKQVMVMAEWDYALLRAGQVLTSSVKVSEKVYWTGQQLSVTYQQEGKVFNDVYYLADKDLNGTHDLYREHLDVPNPVASGLTAFSCTEIKKGLWQITIRAGDAENEISWERIVGQKVCLN